VEFEVPLNGHIDSSGNDWECNPGYRRAGRACSLIDN
jgi:hypothetical protein